MTFIQLKVRQVEQAQNIFFNYAILTISKLEQVVDQALFGGT
jgi:hypothetical protein